MKKPELPEGGYDLVDTRKDRLNCRIRDYSGKIINNLEITTFCCKVYKIPRTIWYTKCYCGKMFWVDISQVKYGRTKSCGCLSKKVAIETGNKLRIGTIYPLLQNTPEIRYWIGFLLADGSFSKDGYVKCSASVADEAHIKRLAKILKSNVSYKEAQLRKMPNGKVYQCNKQIMTQVGDRHTIKLIQNKYDIDTNKTYNPPDFSKLNLTDEERYDIAIGYIDGDGNRYSNKGIRICNHPNWISANELLFAGLLSSSKLETIPSSGQVRAVCIINKYGFSTLLSHIQKYKLPILKRKWYKPKKTKYEVNNWTQQELDILTKMYPVNNQQKMESLLPNHSYGSMKKKCQELGIRKKKK